jgi:thiamine kinase-like enzyme
MSWKGVINNTIVKIFEANTEENANNIARIISLPEVMEFFPRLFFQKGNYLIVEWVEGICLDKLIQSDRQMYIKKIYEFQVRLHQTKYQPTQPCTFDYIDYLISRYKKFGGPFIQDNPDIRDLPEKFAQFAPAENRLFHLDITPVNIVITQNDELKIIDNELLGYGPYYPFDFFNTYHSLQFVNGSQDYLELIQGGSKEVIHWIQENEDLVMSIWNLRILGGSMQSSKSLRALTESYKKISTHPIVQLFDK